MYFDWSEKYFRPVRVDINWFPLILDKQKVLKKIEQTKTLLLPFLEQTIVHIRIASSVALF